MLLTTARILRTTRSAVPAAAASASVSRGAAVASGSRGLCRLNLRTDTHPGPLPPSAADQETFDEHLKSLKLRKDHPAPADAEAAAAVGLDSEAALIALKKAARAAEEESRGFSEGMKECVSGNIGEARARLSPALAQ